ncbi:hypothetical protein PENTCL1PPCAC_3361, partial [Pristionchus entomophagus]
VLFFFSIFSVRLRSEALLVEASFSFIDSSSFDTSFCLLIRDETCRDSTESCREVWIAVRLDSIEVRLLRVTSVFLTGVCNALIETVSASGVECLERSVLSLFFV